MPNVPILHNQLHSYTSNNEYIIMNDDLISYILTYIEVALLEQARSQKENRIVYQTLKQPRSIDKRPLVVYYGPTDDQKYEENQIRILPTSYALANDAELTQLSNILPISSYAFASPSYFISLPALHTLVGTTAWSWRDMSNTVLTKRLKKNLLLLYNFKLDDNFYSLLGSYLKDYLLDNKTYYFDYTAKFDWIAGEYGDHGSCYFNNRASRGALQAMEQLKYFRAIRFYKQNSIPKPVKELLLNANNHQSLYHHMELFRMWGVINARKKNLAQILTKLNSKPQDNSLMITLNNGVLGVSKIAEIITSKSTMIDISELTVLSNDLWNIIVTYMGQYISTYSLSAHQYKKTTTISLTAYLFALALIAETFEEFLYLYNTHKVFVNKKETTLENYFAPLYDTHYKYMQSGRDNGSEAPYGYLTNRIIHRLFNQIVSHIYHAPETYRSYYGYDNTGRQYSLEEFDKYTSELQTYFEVMDRTTCYYNSNTNQWQITDMLTAKSQHFYSLEEFFRYNDQNSFYTGIARTFVLDLPKDFVRQYFNITINDDEPFYLLYNSYGIPLYKTANLFALLTNSIAKRLKTIWRQNKYSNILYINEDIFLMSSSFVLNQFKNEIAFDSLIMELENYNKQSSSSNKMKSQTNTTSSTVTQDTTAATGLTLSAMPENNYWPLEA